MTKNAEKERSLIRVIRPYGIKEIARTGATSLLELFSTENYPRLKKSRKLKWKEILLMAVQMGMKKNVKVAARR